MKTFILLSVLLATWPIAAKTGVVSIRSNNPVEETVQKFTTALNSKGLTLFSVIDHHANAQQADLELKPSTLIIFGNPKIGTKLMQCAATMAIDLPQKVLVWEDENKAVWLSYNNPEYVKERHQMKGCDDVIEKVAKVLAALSINATQA